MGIEVQEVESSRARRDAQHIIQKCFAVRARACADTGDDRREPQPQLARRVGLPLLDVGRVNARCVGHGVRRLQKRREQEIELVVPMARARCQSWSRSRIA